MHFLSRSFANRLILMLPAILVFHSGCESPESPAASESHATGRHETAYAYGKAQGEKPAVSDTVSAPATGGLTRTEAGDSFGLRSDVASHEAYLLKVAANYRSMGRVDDALRFAPTLCWTPPSAARLSTSGDVDTHGDKLYFLFARYRDDYYPKPGTQLDGQVLVKESWAAVEHHGVVPEPTWEPEDDGTVFISRYAERDGVTYRTGEQGDLFIMFKCAPETPDTDAGWVYGTVTADGKNVTSAGRVESCMKCHQKAAVDRLFGLR